VPGSRLREFWLQSLLNEAILHGADPAYAAGSDLDVDADIAADLITNHLAMLTAPRTPPTCPTSPAYAFRRPRR
jgi:hypothetical protein